MQNSMRSLPVFLIVCWTLVFNVALGQSLAIHKRGPSEYFVEASVPSDKPCALQVSGNLHLWVTLEDEVKGQYSLQLERLGVSPRFFRLTPSAEPAPPIRIILLGDSMTADGSGWGGGMHGYFKPNVTIVNYAMAYTSTKIFLRSAELDKMLVVKPDFVLIQYGFVDGAWGPDLAPDRYTSLEEFGENLREIVRIVRGFNGVPILVTLHSARVWDAQGKVIPTWLDRNAVTKAVAAELQTPLIDLNQLTMDLLNELGPNRTQFMQWAGGGPEDLMHLSPQGAEVVAQLVVNALPDSLGPYLNGTFAPPPIP